MRNTMLAGVRRWVRTGLAIVLLTPTVCAVAATRSDASELNELSKAAHTRLVDRASFMVAERLLSKRPISDAAQGRIDRIVQRLHDYPLRPYLEAKNLAVTARGVPQWLAQHGNAPYTVGVRTEYLRHLIRQRAWPRFFDVYPQQTSSGELRCLQVQALIGSGRLAEARAALPELWLTGRSRSNLCDRPFGWWRSTGGLTDALIWERVRMAMERRNIQLARHLSRGLPKAAQSLVGHWRTIYRSPAKVVRFADKYHDSERQQQVLAHGFRRWSARAPEKAAAAWDKFVSAHPMPEHVRHEVERRIGLSFAREHSSLAATWLFRSEREDLDAELAHWQVVSAVRAGAWPKVIDTLNKLPEVDRGGLFATYWRARALEAVAQISQANLLYERLAKDRSYYGFLAADRLGLDYHFNNQALEVSEARLNRLETLPTVQRALEWRALGRLVSFRREWNTLVAGNDAPGLAALGKFAAAKAWHDVAIATVAKGQLYDDLDLRFPLAFEASVMQSAERENLNPAWVFATARQESAFMAYARSGAGAIGVMQLMPRTAREISRKLSEPFGSTHALSEPALNIRFGSYYLRTLHDRLFRHPVLASAAYNAGPHRVRRWLPTQDSMAADTWIESVPFSETRSYIKRILAYHAIYEQQLGRVPTRLIDILKPIPTLSELDRREAQSEG
ncbi:MAG: transglycosylase SLT domain-containing protein [Gammaproteobacteria bacterium]|nr:transglycosylase SLT domain-containing protein [Gammaproteobacteria bacterium]